ncbi:GNAT family N-acetyltransferase [Labrys sp. La1]|uniref:GNAT family N-acetyltransferase n=1 Tax=Labrys sp. La1 TaxID=3404917 RepID=UPI003EB741D2
MSLDPPPIALFGERLLLRSFEPDDADEIFACITPSLTRFMAWEPSPSREAFASIWRNWGTLAEVGSDYIFVVRRRDGLFLGLAGLHRAGSKTPELGIWIREDEHGRGYGREAVAAVAAWASRDPAIQYFQYPVAEANLASRRIAEGLGGIPAAERRDRKYKAVIYHVPRRSQ